MNSFSDYREGSATAEYRAMVDKAAAVAEHQKARVDPMYHEKIDHLLDTYARKLAENMNQGFAIDARVPSVMIAGPANFPVRQKEKQNRARDGNMEEWRHIQGLLDKYKFGNRHFWSEGYYVSTVGLNEATIKKYIQDQERADIMQDKLSVKEYEDPFKG